MSPLLPLTASHATMMTMGFENLLTFAAQITFISHGEYDNIRFVMFPGIIIIILAFLLSLAIHEAAHAYASDRLGDPTARLSGRLTLNPLAHLDPLGTILPFFLIMTGSPFVFGWGKPVPFDPFNLKNPRRDSALISLAGPAANLILSLLLAIFIRLAHLTLESPAFLIESILTSIILLNVTWAVFNLIPIHPLDGGKVLVGFLPQKLALEVDEILHQYGLILLIFLLFPLRGTAPINAIISPIVNIILAILLPSNPLV